MEKQNSTPVDQPDLHGGAQRIPSGMWTFYFCGTAYLDSMGTDLAGGTVPHLLETGAANATTSGHGRTAF